MPYSQLFGMAKGKLEAIQPKTTNCSADLASMPDRELVELVWENGQISMQRQSSRTQKSPPCTNFPPRNSKAQEEDGGDPFTQKIGRSETTESILNDFQSPGPSGHVGMNQDDDDIVPWLNYPLDYSLQHDYCSEFFSELSGVNPNAFSAQNIAVPFYKNSNYDRIVRDSHMASGHDGKSLEQGNASKVVVGGALEPSRPSSSHLCSSSLQQCQTSEPSLRSRTSDFISSNTNNAHEALCVNSIQTPTSTSNLPNTKLHKQDSGPTRPTQQTSDNKGLINFSHFSRHAVLVKDNLQCIGDTANSGLSSISKLRSKDNVSAASNSNHFQPTQIKSTSGSRSATGFQSQLASMPTKMDLKASTSKPPKEPPSTEQSEVMCQEDAFRNNVSPDQFPGQTSSFAASTAIGRPDSDKVIEPVVASSSVCSGNSAGGASNDWKHTVKRKSRDSEESEYQSEDVEEESVGVRKPAPTQGCTGAKKSRAAEVHNLSERRRRDRINEKMRALQELIPNCNKVDKASMLDEAIEYLKTLQLQVQIMSMGSGLCMHPMMLPTGMRHVHTPHMAHFSPMGVGMGMGMGMGMGFGMGMVDISRGSSGFPFIQVPPMHGQQFPCPPISGPSSLPRMAGSCLPMFGLPRQGLPLSMPHAPFIPLSGGPSTKSVSVPDVSGVVPSMEVPDPASPSSRKNPSQMTQKTSADCSQNQKSTQATKEGFGQSALLQRNDQIPHVSGNGAANSSIRDGAV